MPAAQRSTSGGAPRPRGGLYRSAEAKPAYRPELAKVRSRLNKILGEARAARTLPWEPTQLSLYRVIFPQMALWLPEAEAAQFCREFDAEMARLEPA